MNEYVDSIPTKEMGLKLSSRLHFKVLTRFGLATNSHHILFAISKQITLKIVSD